MILSPYLSFNGNCEAAFEFYKTVFGAEITSLNRYEETPIEYPDDYGKKVVFAEIQFENNSIQGTDLWDKNIKPNSPLSLNFMEVFIMDEVFQKLADGGKIDRPLQDTFWGARFGILTDKFGIQWRFSCDLN
jgi:PhnB protein